MSRSDRIILFLKNFRAGKVKSRLAYGLGETAAVEVYRAMVAELLAALQPLRDIVVPYFDVLPGEAEADEALRGLLAGGRCKVQHGGDLGERMGNAFRETFARGAEAALLIGSDIPGIDSSLLTGYLDALRDVPLVIGPAADGGYYLIGFRRQSFRPELFRGIDWSTDMVYAQTVAKARLFELSLYAGPELRDVDIVEDLESILSEQAVSPTLAELIRLLLVEAGS